LVLPPIAQFKNSALGNDKMPYVTSVDRTMLNLFALADEENKQIDPENWRNAIPKLNQICGW